VDTVINNNRTELPMSRIPWAAETLVEEVEDIRPEAVVENTGEPDGFDVIREITFDPETSRWLEPLLATGDDPRIASAVTSKDSLVVTFISDPMADDRTPFYLEAVSAVLSRPVENAELPDEAPEEVSEPETPKKTASKKSSSA
jgi:hypothetical protein